MAIKSAKGKMWLSVTGMVFQVLFNILFYVLVIISAVWLTQKAYHFSYEIFGDVSVQKAPGTDVMITIREGESTKHLADVLEKKQIILNKTSFYIRVRLMVNQDDPILPGIYELNSSMDYKEIIETITDPEQIYPPRIYDSISEKRVFIRSCLIGTRIFVIREDRSITMITDERIGAYIDSLEGEPDELLRMLEKEALADMIPIIKKPTQSLLRFLIRNNKPGKLLEVGAAVGYSSIFMSYYMGDTAHITTIEKMEERAKKARTNIRRAGKEAQITLIEGDASDILCELKEKDESYDMIFMDAAKGQYFNFFPDVCALLKKGGLLVSDNVLQDGDIVQSRYAVTRRDRTIHSRMREYLFALTHSDEFDTVVLPIGDGVTLSTKLK